MSDHDHHYPRDYTDRQLLEAIWYRIDGLSHMVGKLIASIERKEP